MRFSSAFSFCFVAANAALNHLEGYPCNGWWELNSLFPPDELTNHTINIFIQNTPFNSIGFLVNIDGVIGPTVTYNTNRDSCTFVVTSPPKAIFGRTPWGPMVVMQNFLAQVRRTLYKFNDGDETLTLFTNPERKINTLTFKRLPWIV
eukprot:Blabericola_migrator_1__10193@NODE_569_length_7540_cov_46_110130_g424_i0_p7_GENE_NODE_569_length_7540_cov_46_110130_g424_i0NODE_569_length_7540_cov_46_110130_g424_i0_p7_ORF_typecomplete_len148_score6_37_NODE_569_length_7540_cov_46_110130_g424_i046665109